MSLLKVKKRFKPEGLKELSLTAKGNKELLILPI